MFLNVMTVLSGMDYGSELTVNKIQINSQQTWIQKESHKTSIFPRNTTPFMHFFRLYALQRPFKGSSSSSSHHPRGLGCSAVTLKPKQLRP